MATADIDRLEIEVDASSAQAVQHIKDLSSALQGMKRSARSATDGLSNLNTQLKNVKTSGTSASKVLKGVRAALGAIGFRQVVRFLGDAVTSINDYVENVNLFQVSMGKYYQEAFDYAQLVSDKLDVDPSQWMRTQGVFMSMANGFGMAEDKAYALSEGLTELSYDLSSLYNEDIESAALRLQSALAGEIEPIRRLGISISQATLEEYRLAKGIDESVSKMTEQEKALLRSLKLIEGARDIGAIGDFAKTLESPANAIRVLNAQITRFKRAIGSVMLPVIIQVLPYIQAFVSLLADLISRLAVLVGFEMPEWDNSAWETNFGGASDSVDDTTSSVKKLKKEVMGIDELTILGDKSGSGNGGVGGTSSWVNDFDIPELWDKNAIAQIETQSQKIRESLEGVLAIASLIGAVFLGWKIAQSVPKSLQTIKDAIKLLGGTLADTATPNAVKLGSALQLAGVAGAIWIVIGRFKELYENNEQFRRGVDRLGDILGGLGNAASDVFGGIARWLKDSELNFSDFGLTALGVAMMFLPGGKLGGAIILGFEAISLALRGLGLVSDEEWYLMTEAAHDWWYKTKISALDLRLDLEEKFRQIGQKFRELVDGFKGSFQSAIDELKRKWESFKSWWTGKKSLKIDVSSYKTGGDDNSAWKNNFASGGFPAQGQMFIAREAGPEMVGRIGNRTAVANNDQIVAGIASGVANANTDVISAIYAVAQQVVSTIESQTRDVYLNGQKVTDVTAEIQSRRNRMYGR